MNVTEPDGTHVDGHPPYLFESGTVTSGSENCPAGLQYLTDTSKNWTTNQWAGYTARRLSDNWIGEIISNTNNTLTMYFYYSGGGCISTWRANDQYQIHQVLVALDQPGRARRSDYWRSAYQQHDRNDSVAASGVEAMLFMEQYPFAGGRAYKFHSHFNVSRNSFTEPRLLQRYHSSGIHALRLSASVGKRFSYAYPDTNCHSDADAYAECNPDYYTNADADGATTSKAKAPPSSVTV